MQLRYRIFLLVGSIFLGVIALFVGVYYYLILTQVQKGTRDIKDAIEARNEDEQKNLRSFFGMKAIGIESRILTLFEKVNEFNWLRVSYVPSEFNYLTNEWSSTALLLAANEWLDLAQVYTTDKLTALIVSRQPFLEDFTQIPIDKDLSVVARKTASGDYNLYIAIPYWMPEFAERLTLGLSDMFLRMEEGRMQWLIFTVDQILNVPVATLKPGVMDIPESVEIFGSKGSKSAYAELMKNTIATIGKAQKRLLSDPYLRDILQSKEKSAIWVKEKIGSVAPKEKEYATVCKSPICLSLGSHVEEQHWREIENWDMRFIHRSLVWQMSVITGSGIWKYDPLDPFAPKGIVSFYREDSEPSFKAKTYTGVGVLAKDVFLETPIPIPETCTPIGVKGDYGACMIPDLKIVTFKNSTDIFLTGTLVFTDIKSKKVPKPTGKITVGVNITPLLQELALATTGKIFFLAQGGEVIVFDTNGNIETENWHTENLRELTGKKEGTIADIEGEEYYFLHLSSLLGEHGQVFMIQTKENEFKLIDQLKARTRLLLDQLILQSIIVICIALIIAYFLLNHVLKKITQPVVELANATKQIGAGRLDLVTVSERGKKRTDETGMLCRAFEQMVQEMQEGETVRGILNKVVSKEVAEKIIREGVRLGGELRTVTVLFCDVRHFTHISESMEPQEVLEMLNDCFTVLSHVIDDFEGVIDKYVGDSIMALFGAPIDIENHALQAILCAKMMMRVLHDWNQQRNEAGLSTLNIGIGIHTGAVIAGNVGAENHLNYTVLGHNVNLASRICDYAKEMEILVTEDTLNGPGVKDVVKYEALPPVIFRGISTAIPLFLIDPYS